MVPGKLTRRRPGGARRGRVSTDPLYRQTQPPTQVELSVRISSLSPPPTGPATDLGYLFRKNPDRHQTFEVFGGTAHVFYPEATEERRAAALFLGVDPIDLVRGAVGAPAPGSGWDRTRR